jgi:O-antigen ligase
LLGLALILAPSRRLSRPQLYISFGIIFVLGCWGIVLHEQLSPAPWFAAPHPLWAEAGQVLGVSLQPSVSIVRNEPFYAAGPCLAAVLALWVGVILGASRRIARWLLWVVAISGALYAFYGLVSALLQPDVLLFRERESFAGYVTGTFVNHNTAAAYFGCCTSIWLLLAGERARQSLPHKFSSQTSWSEVRALAHRRDILLLFAGFSLCLTALFMTGSRAGVVLSLAVLAAAATLYISLDWREHRGLSVLLTAISCIITSLYLVFGGTIDARFDALGFTDGGRSETYRATLRLIAGHPWFGSGLGTFSWAFPAYRSADASAWGIWNVAHSTPLELAADLGIPLTLVIGSAWIAILCILARGVFVRRRDAIIPLAGLSVALIGLSHSSVDFSFQVPGFAIVAMAVTGAGIAQAFPSQSPRDLQDL